MITYTLPFHTLKSTMIHWIINKSRHQNILFWWAHWWRFLMHCIMTNLTSTLGILICSCSPKLPTCHWSWLIYEENRVNFVDFQLFRALNMMYLSPQQTWGQSNAIISCSPKIQDDTWSINHQMNGTILLFSGLSVTFLVSIRIAMPISIAKMLRR